MSSFSNYLKYFRYLPLVQSLVEIVTSKAKPVAIFSALLDAAEPLVVKNNPGRAEEIYKLVDELQAVLAKYGE